MPMAALRPCAAPQCPNLVTKGRCPTHARQQDVSRGTAQERGYDYAWSQYSADFRARFPVCGMRADGQVYHEHSLCQQEGRTTPAQCVDHTIPHRGNRELFWDCNNHMSLCWTCHSHKTATEDGGFGHVPRVGTPSRTR